MKGMLAVFSKVEPKTTMSRCSRRLWGDDEIKQKDVYVGDCSEKSVGDHQTAVAYEYRRQCGCWAIRSCPVRSYPLGRDQG
jgi:hypothetical protein